jgi:hypothetical protein
MKTLAPEVPVVHLVDDDDSLRKALSRVLNAAGHEVRTYASAADFLLERAGSPRGWTCGCRADLAGWNSSARWRGRAPPCL